MKTEGPWRTDPDYNNEAVLGSDDILVADCNILNQTGKRSIEINQANARFIVLACNNFERMREALQKASKEIQRGGHADRWATVHVINALLRDLEEEGENP